MGEIPLRVLLFLFGGFAILSAFLTARARARVGESGSGLVLVEFFFGAGLLIVVLPGVGSLGTAVGFGVATAGVVILTTGLHALKTRELRRAREESEGTRLYTRIKFGVGEAEATPSEGTPPEATPARKKTLAEAVLGDDTSIGEALGKGGTTGEEDPSDDPEETPS